MGEYYINLTQPGESFNIKISGIEAAWNTYREICDCLLDLVKINLVDGKTGEIIDSCEIGC